VVDIDTNLINKYFDIILKYDKNNNPIINITFKREYKSNKPYLLSEKGYPITSSNIEYFYYYIVDVELSVKIYNERKKLFPVTNKITWYINNFIISDNDKHNLLLYYKSITNKISNSLLNHYSSEEGIKTKKKLVERNIKYSKQTGEHNSKLWKNEDWKNKVMNDRFNSKMYEKIGKCLQDKWIKDIEFRNNMTLIMNDKNRTSKIRETSKKMWNDFRNNKNSIKINNMLYSSTHKNYKNKGISMNKLEYEFSLILDELLLNWQYEKLFTINNKLYRPDFFINDNIIIECYGDYWHANPLKYNKHDNIFRNVTSEEIWKKDNERKYNFEQNNYKFIFFYETDIYKNKMEITNQLKKFLHD